MGSSISKLLLPLGSTTALRKTVAAFEAVAEIKELVLTSRAVEQEQFRKELATVSKPISFVAGGAVRQESVLKSLQFLENRGLEPAETFLLIHDAARCFVTPNVIEHTISSVYDQLAVTVAVPAVDSMIEVATSGFIKRSLNREAVWLVQTPQAFRMDLLLQAHRQYPGAATDDASLVEKIHPVQVVRGERLNFKLTTPEDYQLAQALVQQQSC